MKNSIFLFFFGCLLITSSCTNEDYNINNIDKQVVFSPNGISIPIGNFDKIDLDFKLEGAIDELSYEKDFEGFFTEELYKKFIIKRNGIEEGIGSLEFSADFSAYIKNDEGQVRIKVTAVALDRNKNIIIRMYDDELYANNDESELQKQHFILKIEQKDIAKMKYAENLRFSFKIRTAEYSINPEDNNYAMIENIRIKSTGGISLDFDNLQ